MPNRSVDAVFHLVKSLKKAEKRHFKLYFKRSGSQAEFKLVKLFDALDKMEHYDEDLLLKRTKSISKKQLSNTKAYLSRQILTSLRQLHSETYYDVKLHQDMDQARLLYNKGLYLESLKLLSSIKEDARAIRQHVIVLQVINFEKHIEYLHITRSFEERAEQLANESVCVQKEIAQCEFLSNLSLRLYSWYIRRGHARNEEDIRAITAYVRDELNTELRESHGFYQRLHLSQALCWYAFIVQDFLLYYRHAQKWVDLFEEEPAMKPVEIMHYTKGMHNLLNAHFMLRNVIKYDELLTQYSLFIDTMDCFQHDNATVQSLVYYYIARLNQYFMKGLFTEGLSIVPQLERQIEKNKIHLDGHRILVFYYKIACLYFGSGNKKKAIDYLNRIINWKTDLRTDLQCYARLLHLLAHYDMGNMDLVEHLVKSVYRFMAKMQNLSGVEEEIFRFLRKAFYVRPNEIDAGFQELRRALKQYEDNPLMARSFMYLDLISWLESKIEKRPVEIIIQEKFERDLKNRTDKLGFHSKIAV